MTNGRIFDITRRDFSGFSFFFGKNLYLLPLLVDFLNVYHFRSQDFDPGTHDAFNHPARIIEMLVKFGINGGKNAR